MALGEIWTQVLPVLVMHRFGFPTELSFTESHLIFIFSYFKVNKQQQNKQLFLFFDCSPDFPGKTGSAVIYLLAGRSGQLSFTWAVFLLLYAPEPDFLKTFRLVQKLLQLN